MTAVTIQEFMSRASGELANAGWVSTPEPWIDSARADQLLERNGFLLLVEVAPNSERALGSWVLRLNDLVIEVDGRLNPPHGCHGIIVTDGDVPERLSAVASRYPVTFYQVNQERSLQENIEEFVTRCDFLSRQGMRSRVVPQEDLVEEISEAEDSDIDGSAADEHLARSLSPIPLADREERAEQVSQKIDQLLPILGERHPSVLFLRAESARLLMSEEKLRSVLSDQERFLGVGSPDVIGTKAALANILRDQGSTLEAAELYREATQEARDIFGFADPKTLSLQDKVASTYVQAGRISEAVELLEHVVADRELILGPQNSATLTSLNNLAYTYAQVGRLQEAIDVWERIISDQARLLGDDHLSTLASRDNLASAYRDAGRVQESVALLERIVADRERILGADHPATLTSRNNLAYAYREAGRLQEAVALLELVLADRERILGADHPATLTSRN
ncbi:tetratricopeptide repeat protein, partial [Streptomyces sp. NPDC001312]|uniref:tetratricopeptide repeat protein n=1 Tax=Streptomyces sp. NPDC001312 TaxID=3364561 RepID=UPI0036BAF17A